MQMAQTFAHKLLFFGTSAICLPFLERLHKDFELPLIITQPDSVGGRNHQAIIPPVKSFAIEQGIPFIQPETLKDETVAAKILAIQPHLAVVVSYGQLIPKQIFQIPPFRTVNVHFSMLPFYRGAAPVQRALENGDQTSGITIFEIVRKLDAGAIWAQQEIAILPTDTTLTLWERMSCAGAAFLCETIDNILAQRIQKFPQDETQASLAPPIQKEEGQVNWHQTARQLYNKFRAFTPWPGLNCDIKGKWFKLTIIKESTLTHRQQPGDVFGMDKTSLQVCCGNGSVLEIHEFQPQGKKPMSPYCYCRGNELPECLL